MFRLNAIHTATQPKTSDSISTAYSDTMQLFTECLWLFTVQPRDFAIHKRRENPCIGYYAVAIYEMLASNSEQQNFTIKDAHDVPISSTRWAIANKDATFAAFFDLRKIKNVCNDYGLDFQHRLAYRSDDSVALVGELKQGVHAATSWYVQRRKYKLSSKHQGVASKTLTDKEKESVKDLNAKINELIAALRPVTAQLKVTKADILDLKSQRKSLPAGVHRQALYAELQVKKTQRNWLQSKIFNLKDQVKVCKAIKYNTLYIKVLFTNMW